MTAILVLKPKLEQLPGPYVGIMMPASVGASVFLLAALFAGKTPVMVNWTTGTRALRHSLDTLGVSTVVTARALLAKLGSAGIDVAAIEDTFLFVEDVLAAVRPAEKLRAALRSRLSRASLERVRPPATAVVLFTSGSESLPKAVPLTHGNLLANIADILKMGQLEERDITVGLLPPFHSFGLTTTVLLSWCLGLRTVFHPNPTESALLAKVIDTYKCNGAVRHADVPRRDRAGGGRPTAGQPAARRDGRREVPGKPLCDARRTLAVGHRARGVRHHRMFTRRGGEPRWTSPSPAPSVR